MSLDEANNIITLCPIRASKVSLARTVCIANQKSPTRALVCAVLRKTLTPAYSDSNLMATLDQTTDFLTEIDRHFYLEDRLRNYPTSADTLNVTLGFGNSPSRRTGKRSLRPHSFEVWAG